ncbi:hypothetical protein CEXT_234531 [Caerostris extrusa]|uniref:Uncharacterized protein n=1 Tax=Caerostris extrusa TaxID=172846 RepID=A0AAV4MZI7_CAEEX|nr:hypothetical protein CEXT_234531 [Caerostris extrusa]
MSNLQRCWDKQWCPDFSLKLVTVSLRVLRQNSSQSSSIFSQRLSLDLIDSSALYGMIFSHHEVHVEHDIMPLRLVWEYYYRGHPGMTAGA